MKKLFLALSVLTLVSVASLQASCCGGYARRFFQGIGQVATLGVYNPCCSDDRFSC